MATAVNFSYLPDECWENVFKFHSYYNDRDYTRVMKSLSVVSKRFLSITNRLRYSITIRTQSYRHLGKLLPILFQRFPNLTSLNLPRCYYTVDFRVNLNDVLYQISKFPFKLTSLTFSAGFDLPINGLRAFSKKITTLTSLTCSIIDSTNRPGIFFIADCFPLLEELNLSYSDLYFRCSTSIPSIIPSIVEPFSLALFKLRKVNLSGQDYVNDKFLFHLFKNCKLLEEANFSHCVNLNVSEMNFEVSKLEVLNLSYTSVDDKALLVISKCCCGLLQLILERCPNVTERGVKHVVDNCTQLKVINLRNCYKVDADFAALILLSRLSLIR